MIPAREQLVDQPVVEAEARPALVTRSAAGTAPGARDREPVGRQADRPASGPRPRRSGGSGRWPRSGRSPPAIRPGHGGEGVPDGRCPPVLGARPPRSGRRRSPRPTRSRPGTAASHRSAGCTCTPSPSTAVMRHSPRSPQLRGSCGQTSALRMLESALQCQGWRAGVKRPPIEAPMRIRTKRTHGIQESPRPIDMPETPAPHSGILGERSPPAPLTRPCGKAVPVMVQVAHDPSVRFRPQLLRSRGHRVRRWAHARAGRRGRAWPRPWSRSPLHLGRARPTP